MEHFRYRLNLRPHTDLVRNVEFIWTLVAILVFLLVVALVA